MPLTREETETMYHYMANYFPPDSRLEEIAAENTRDPNTLTTLAKSESIPVLVAVAKNTATPPEILERLAEHEEWRIQSAVVWNEKTPDRALSALIKRAEARRKKRSEARRK